MIIKNLRASREDLDLKQKDIADFFDLHYSTISGNEYSLSLDYLFGIISRNEKYDPTEFDIEELAKNLTELRLKNKVTQEFVAKKLNTSQSAYSHYEKAINVIPTTFLYGLTKIYKPFSIDELFGRKKSKKSD